MAAFKGAIALPTSAQPGGFTAWPFGKENGRSPAGNGPARKLLCWNLRSSLDFSSPRASFSANSYHFPHSVPKFPLSSAVLCQSAWDCSAAKARKKSGSVKSQKKAKKVKSTTTKKTNGLVSVNGQCPANSKLVTRDNKKACLCNKGYAQFCTGTNSVKKSSSGSGSFESLRLSGESCHSGTLESWRVRSGQPSSKEAFKRGSTQRVNCTAASDFCSGASDAKNSLGLDTQGQKTWDQKLEEVFISQDRVIRRWLVFAPWRIAALSFLACIAAYKVVPFFWGRLPPLVLRHVLLPEFVPSKHVLSFWVNVLAAHSWGSILFYKPLLLPLGLLLSLCKGQLVDGVFCLLIAANFVDGLHRLSKQAHALAEPSTKVQAIYHSAFLYSQRWRLFAKDVTPLINGFLRIKCTDSFAKALRIWVYALPTIAWIGQAVMQGYLWPTPVKGGGFMVYPVAGNACRICGPFVGYSWCLALILGAVHFQLGLIVGRAEAERARVEQKRSYADL